MKYIHSMPEGERIEKTTNIIHAHIRLQNKQVIENKLITDRRELGQ